MATDGRPPEKRARRRDVAKIFALTAVRKINRLSLERWSRSSFRPTGGAASAAKSNQPMSAKDLLARRSSSERWLPPAIKVLHPIPHEGRLSLRYVAPYYGLAAAAFKIHSLFPIAGSAWDPGAFYASLFPPNGEGWTDIQDDEQFATLRLQGPNPFLLKAADDGDGFVVDYGPPFENAWNVRVCCRFRLERQRFVATRIEIEGDAGKRTVGPQDDERWRDAKLLANALDARYAIFGQHLTTAHFLVAQAFAIAAAYGLPPEHRLQRFMRLLTRGVLQVNHYALQLLITKESYFRQSRFVSVDPLYAIISNRIAAFSSAELEPERHIRAHGLDAIDDHPYVTDARDAWAVIRDYTQAIVDLHYHDDAAVLADDALATWHGELLKLLPQCSDLKMRTKDDLIVRLASLVYNNVMHEVSGDFSPYTGARSVDAKRLVSLEGLRSTEDVAPVLRDVFLFEQGAYAGTFNVAGNNMMHTRLDGRLPDRESRETDKFRRALRLYERRVDERNQYRPRPFLRMRPSQWEWSVSF